MLASPRRDHRLDPTTPAPPTNPSSPATQEARPGRPSQDKASCQSRRGIVQGRRRSARRACFLRCYRRPHGDAMGANVRAVDVEDAPVDVSPVTGRDVQTLENTIEESLTRPVPVAPVDRLPLLRSDGHVALFRIGVEDPEDVVEDGAVVGPPLTALLARAYPRCAPIHRP